MERGQGVGRDLKEQQEDEEELLLQDDKLALSPSRLFFCPYVSPLSRPTKITLSVLGSSVHSLLACFK